MTEGRRNQAEEIADDRLDVAGGNLAHETREYVSITDDVKIVGPGGTRPRGILDTMSEGETTGV